jgi:hypothetical protein
MSAAVELFVWLVGFVCFGFMGPFPFRIFHAEYNERSVNIERPA